MRYRPYPEYRDSGVEWLGSVPRGWDVKRFRYSCRIQEGQVDPEDERFSERVLIAPNHIESGTGKILLREASSEQGAISGKYRVDPGDLIYSKIRPALRKACISEGHWLCSADMYPIRVTGSRLKLRFLLYSVLSDPFSRLMIDESMRVAMPKVNRETLADTPLLLPPAADQAAIVTLLDSETARIDALVAKKERLIELLNEKRAALITRGVTKGLDPNVPMKDSGVEWLGEIPAHWKVRKLRHIARELGVGVVVNPSSYVSDDGLPFLYGSDIREGRVDAEGARRIRPEDSLRLRKSRLGAGDLVMVRVGAPGVTAVITPDLEGANCASLLVIRPRAGVSPDWLCYALNSRPVRHQVQLVQYGAAQEQFNVNHAVDFVVPCPPPAEQSAVAEAVRKAAARLDALRGEVGRATDLLKEYRAALISAAVTGKIDVRGWGPAG